MSQVGYSSQVADLPLGLQTGPQSAPRTADEFRRSRKASHEYIQMQLQEIA